MTPRSVDVRIDEVVVHGLPRLVPRSLEQTIARSLEDELKMRRPAWHGRAESAREVAPFVVSDAEAEALGRQIAASIAEALG